MGARIVTTEFHWGKKMLGAFVFSLNAWFVPSFYVDCKNRIKRNAPCHRKSELNMKVWQKSMPVFKINNEIQTLKKMI